MYLARCFILIEDVMVFVLIINDCLFSAGVGISAAAQSTTKNLSFYLLANEGK